MKVRILSLVLLLSGACPVWAGCGDSPVPGVVWVGCLLDGRDLREVQLAKAQLREVSAFRTDLSGADLSQFDGRRGKFIRSNLTAASLEGARLAEADFTGARLVGAKLSGADLRRARLNGADLSQADLSNARLDGAEFNHAHLSGARWSDGRVCASNSVGQCR